MGVKPLASIIILDFLKSRRVQENVESLLKQKTDFPFEIIIIDNSCDPENAKRLRKLEKNPLISVTINEKNVGYIRGNNQGAKLAQGEFLLIVNPDIIWPKTDLLQQMISFMKEHSDTGIMAPKQINETDGKVAMTVRAFPKLFLQIARRTFLRKLPLIKKWVAHDEMRHLDYSKTQAVDWVQSSFWVIRKDLWDSLGGLNPKYFIFMSDPDLCYKVWQKGFKVIYNADLIVHADGLRASRGGFYAFFRKWTLRQHVKDSIKYCWNHKFKRNPRKK
jgi:GT2 family glycosyltransferase